MVLFLLESVCHGTLLIILSLLLSLGLSRNISLFKMSEQNTMDSGLKQQKCISSLFMVETGLVRLEASFLVHLVVPVCLCPDPLFT